MYVLFWTGKPWRKRASFMLKLPNCLYGYVDSAIVGCGVLWMNWECLKQVRWRACVRKSACFGLHIITESNYDTPLYWRFKRFGLAVHSLKFQLYMRKSVTCSWDISGNSCKLLFWYIVCGSSSSEDAKRVACRRTHWTLQNRWIYPIESSCPLDLHRMAFLLPSEWPGIEHTHCTNYI